MATPAKPAAPKKKSALSSKPASSPPATALVASLSDARGQRVSAILAPLDDLINQFDLSSVAVTRADKRSQDDLDLEYLQAEFSEYTPSPELSAAADTIECRGASEAQVRQLVSMLGFNRLPLTLAELYGLLAFGRRLSYQARLLPQTPPPPAPAATEGFLLAAKALLANQPADVMKANLSAGTTLESEASAWVAQGGGAHAYVLARIQDGLTPVEALKAHRMSVFKLLTVASRQERPAAKFVPGHWPYMSEPVFAPLRDIPYNFVPNYNYPRDKVKTSLGGALIGELDTCRYFGDASTAFYKNGFYLDRAYTGRDDPVDHADEVGGQETIRVLLAHPKIRETLEKAGLDFMDWLAQAVPFAIEIVPGTPPDELGHCLKEPELHFLIPLGDYPEHNSNSRKYKAWLARQVAAGKGPPEGLSERDRMVWEYRLSHEAAQENKAAAEAAAAASKAAGKGGKSSKAGKTKGEPK
jgi:hypothetical protein